MKMNSIGAAREVLTAKAKILSFAKRADIRNFSIAFNSPPTPFLPLTARELRRLSKTRQARLMADGTSETTRQIAFAASFTSQILKTYVEGYAAHLGLIPFLIETAEFNQGFRSRRLLTSHLIQIGPWRPVFCFASKISQLAGARRLLRYFTNYFTPALERLAAVSKAINLSYPCAVFLWKLWQTHWVGSDSLAIWHEACRARHLARTYDTVSLVDLDDLMSNLAGPIVLIRVVG